MIGVYDSGLGGLAVLSRLRQRFPRADLLYFGDTAHLPYGGQPISAIRRYAEGALTVFREAGVSALVIACGTVSTTLLEGGFLRAEFPLYGVVAPAARAVARSGKKRIAVLATAASVDSRVYARRIGELCPDASVLELACPTLVPLIEAGMTDARDPKLLSALRHALAPCFRFHPEAILLGCTHYAWLIPALRTLFPFVSFIDCGDAAARELDAPAEGNGNVRYCVSGDPARFREAASRVSPLGSVAVRQIAIT